MSVEGKGHALRVVKACVLTKIGRVDDFVWSGWQIVSIVVMAISHIEGSLTRAITLPSICVGESFARTHGCTTHYTVSELISDPKEGRANMTGWSLRPIPG